MRLYYRTEHFGALVFNAATGRYFQLSSADAMALIVRDADVEHTMGIAAPYELVRITNKRALPDVLSAPFKVFFNITKRCNLFCKHCFNDSGRRDSAELDATIIEQTLRALQMHGIMKVTLAGGEPLYHRSIARILELLRSLDLDLSLITNGVGVTASLAVALSRISTLRGITVSLDGAIAKENDLVRGHGAYAKTMSGFTLLRKHYRGKLALRTTLMRVNMPSYRDLPELAKHLGADELKINRLNPYGRAAGHDDWQMSAEEFRTARDHLIEDCAKIGILLEIPAYKYQVDDDGRLGLCRAGEETCEIDGDGTVYPCSFSGGRLAAGNITTTEFRDILTQLQRHTLNNEVCYTCRGRGGTREHLPGFVPQLVALRRRDRVATT